jgi:N12 class adenine-specific DNA methylase
MHIYADYISILLHGHKFSTLLKMLSSGMLHLLALVGTDMLAELIASIMRVTRIGKLGTTLAVTSNRKLTDSCHCDNGGSMFLQNVGSYKSHMA